MREDDHLSLLHLHFLPPTRSVRTVRSSFTCKISTLSLSSSSHVHYIMAPKRARKTDPEGRSRQRYGGDGRVTKNSRIKATFAHRPSGPPTNTIGALFFLYACVDIREVSFPSNPRRAYATLSRQLAVANHTSISTCSMLEKKKNEI